MNFARSKILPDNLVKSVTHSVKIVVSVISGTKEGDKAWGNEGLTVGIVSFMADR